MLIPSTFSGAGSESTSKKIEILHKYMSFAHLNLRTDIDILGRTEPISNIFNILIRALNMLIEEASHLTQRYVMGEVSIFREAFAFKAIQKSTERHTTCKNYKVLCENVPEVIQDVCNDNECFIVFILILFLQYNFFLLDSTH